MNTYTVLFNPDPENPNRTDDLCGYTFVARSHADAFLQVKKDYVAVLGEMHKLVKEKERELDSINFQLKGLAKKSKAKDDPKIVEKQARYIAVAIEKSMIEEKIKTMPKFVHNLHLKSDHFLVHLSLSDVNRCD